MAASYAVFANGGKRAAPYAAWEIRSSSGDVIYRHDNDVPPKQVLETRVVNDMNFLLNKVVEEGTGKRAALDGVKTAGKTGTTNAYRDAWFVGYTGNLAAAVWYGNDDHSTMNDMTGGTLPAMTWKEVMTVAHQNIEIRPIPGLEPGGPTVASKPGSTPTDQQAQSQAYLAGTLTRRSYEVLGGIGNLFKSAERPAAVKEAEAQRNDVSAGGAASASRQVAMP
jgi:penicillin-binding protein 1A